MNDRLEGCWIGSKQRKRLARSKTPMHRHRQVYRNTSLPLQMRLRSATACLEYERPRLAVTAVVTEGGDFAQRLEQAVRRSGMARQIEGSKIIDAEPAIAHEQPASELDGPMASFRGQGPARQRVKLHWCFDLVIGALIAKGANLIAIEAKDKEANG